uniref:BHLH domain-containing protein n=1 Tax=Xenopus laevis TaxID=8355 RepID=A1L3I0_XENLA|nr:Unknown (protein for MGC:160633) [Xenopus laevis]
MPDMEYTDTFPSRKILKPVVEKQRRDRINRSLGEMRILLFQLTGNQKLQNPKMEKAEILELAVIYIRNVTRMKTHDPNKWASPAEKMYVSGFRECLDRTEDFISEISPKARAVFLDNLQTHLQQRLLLPQQVGGPGGDHEEDLMSNGSELSPIMDYSISRDELSLCTPSSSLGSESGSPPAWLPSSPPNPHEQPPLYIWRPWP